VTLWPSESPQPKPPRQTYVDRWKTFAALSTNCAPPVIVGLAHKSSAHRRPTS